MSWEDIAIRENKTFLWPRQEIGQDNAMKVFPVKEVETSLHSSIHASLHPFIHSLIHSIQQETNKKTLPLGNLHSLGVQTTNKRSKIHG